MRERERVRERVSESEREELNHWREREAEKRSANFDSFPLLLSCLSSLLLPFFSLDLTSDSFTSKWLDWFDTSVLTQVTIRLRKEDPENILEEELSEDGVFNDKN